MLKKIIYFISGDQKIQDLQNDIQALKEQINELHNTGR